EGEQLGGPHEALELAPGVPRIGFERAEGAAPDRHRAAGVEPHDRGGEVLPQGVGDDGRVRPVEGREDRVGSAHVDAAVDGGPLKSSDYEGAMAACSRKPRARTTLRTVANSGFPSGESAL